MALTRKDSEVEPQAEQMMVSGIPLNEESVAALWERIDLEAAHRILGLPGEVFGGPHAWWRFE